MSGGPLIWTTAIVAMVASGFLLCLANAVQTKSPILALASALMFIACLAWAWRAWIGV